MKIFISQSGPRSEKVAQLLSEWLGCVVQALNPWISTSGIDRGALWFTEIGDQLRDCDRGIICLTKENMQRPWILFEAGALAKGLPQNRVCTFLIDLEPIDLQGPLEQFNHTLCTKESVFELIKTLNKSLGDKALSLEKLTLSFQTFWPKFELGIQEVLDETAGPIPSVVRTSEDLLAEILSTNRRLEKMLRDTCTSPSWAISGSSSDGEIALEARVDAAKSVMAFFEDCVEIQDGSSLTATSLYEKYCDWCDQNEKVALALPTFGREFGELGVQKLKIAGRVRYMGIALRH